MKRPIGSVMAESFWECLELLLIQLEKLIDYHLRDCMPRIDRLDGGRKSGPFLLRISKVATFIICQTIIFLVWIQIITIFLFAITNSFILIVTR
jgi:hypothetical protein